MDGLAPLQGFQNLRQKALPVHVAAGLGKALRRPLLRAQEEVVQVEERAAQRLGEPRAQRGFPAGAVAVDGHDPAHRHLSDPRQ